MTAASPRQRDVLLFIRGFRASRGYAPSIREIGDALGIASTNGVNDLLRALRRKGLLDRPRQVARALTITPKGRREIGEVSP